MTSNRSLHSRLCLSLRMVQKACGCWCAAVRWKRYRRNAVRNGQ